MAGSFWLAWLSLRAPQEHTERFYVKKSDFCYQGKLLMMFKNPFLFSKDQKLIGA
jgi:hypothetical protein